MLTRLLAFHPKTNTTLLERCFPPRNRHLLAVVSIQLLAIVQSHAQPPTELSRANTQPVYEWIFVPGLIDYPSLSAPGSVWDMVWDPQQEKVLAVRARFSDDTWLWDGSGWAVCDTLGNAPPRRRGTAMVYDAKNEVATEALPELDLNDLTAQTLGYQHDASSVDPAQFPQRQPDHLCSNCTLYTGRDGDEWGPCGLFPGRAVSAGGWCSAWAPRRG